MSVYANDKPSYLVAAIESMLNQTIPPEQFVIVLDGPVNVEIHRILEKYCNGNPNVFTIVKLDKNGGLANALNHGLRACRNELVARMDADDISKTHRCELELSEFAKDPELAVCGCNLEEFYGKPENVKTYRVVPSSYEEVKKFARRRQPVNHATVIYKKSVVEVCGGYIPTRRKEDFDLFSRILANGYIIRNIKPSLYSCRTEEDNYYRRKSWTNCSTAIYVYFRHLKRGGCNVLDFFVMCGGEIVFLISPRPVMKFLSDKILRKSSIGIEFDG